MKTLFFLRHGDIDSGNRYIGKTDLYLSPVGENQIRELHREIAKIGFDVVFTSPLKRCIQTAQFLGLEHDIRYDNRLREVDFGLWEGKTFAEISTSEPQAVAEWSTGTDGFCFPEGERMVDFQNRITTFGNHLYGLEAEKVLIISHGGVIRHLICQLLHLPYEKYLCFQVEYGRICTVDLFDEGGVLTGLNKRAGNG